jgi:uncharacterized protein YbbC (DUF1343 family)
MRAMKFIGYVVLLLILLPPVEARGAGPDAAATLLPDSLAGIATAVEEAIRAGETPGAVVLVGSRGQVVYRRAFGTLDGRRPMAVDALFDLASLTKVVATAPAVLQLAEKGRLKLEAPAAAYWPEFRGQGKERITICQLLTHYSGLRPGLPDRPPWTGYAAAIQKILADKPVAPPDERFIYSDLNFIVLGEVVRRVSGEPLDAFCRRRIFDPLGMKDTLFRPGPERCKRLVPTMEGSCGAVHDPSTRRMGGVSGAAGLFSTADDLARFAQALLNEGRSPGGRILSPLSVREMGLPQSPPDRLPARGLGWAVHCAAGGWSEMLPPGSFGHKGYTGTLVWIDPERRTYLVVLSNRVYPEGDAHEGTLRDRVFDCTVEAAGRAAATAGPAQDNVLTGVDALSARHFAPLSGKRVGVITNHSGLDASGRRTIDLLAGAPGVRLKAIFSPEHGLDGKAEGRVASGSDAATRLPVYSLYGAHQRPAPPMLKGLDALVFDVQDAGVRFFTYITTMAYAMEEAARSGVEFVVLDRPNPITAARVEGPVMDPDLKSFTGYFPLSIRHGMTIGELARMFNGENKIGARLRVIPLQGYSREMWFDDTGLAWVNPSPNLRSLTQAILYPAVALAEASNVSVGRGTAAPFELIGAPWITADELARHLQARRLPGVEFEAASFNPAADRFKGETCRGTRIILKDRSLDTVALGIEILCALQRLHPGVFQLDKALPMVGSRRVLQAIADGREPGAIIASWQPQLEAFRRLRERYLLY